MKSLCGKITNQMYIPSTVGLEMAYGIFRRSQGRIFYRWFDDTGETLRGIHRRIDIHACDKIMGMKHEITD